MPGVRYAESMVALAAAEVLPHTPAVPATEVRVGVGKPTLASYAGQLLTEASGQDLATTQIRLTGRELSHVLASAAELRNAEETKHKRFRPLTPTASLDLTIQENRTFIGGALGNAIDRASSRPPGRPDIDTGRPVVQDKNTKVSSRLAMMLDEATEYTIPGEELVLLVKEAEMLAQKDPKAELSKPQHKTFSRDVILSQENAQALIARGAERSRGETQLTPLRRTVNIQLETPTREDAHATLEEMVADEVPPVESPDAERERKVREVLTTANKAWVRACDWKGTIYGHRGLSKLMATSVALQLDPTTEVGKYVRSDILRFIKGIQLTDGVPPEIRKHLQSAKDMITDDMILDPPATAAEHPLVKHLQTHGIELTPDMLKKISDWKVTFGDVFTILLNEPEQRKKLENAWDALMPQKNLPLKRRWYHRQIQEASGIVYGLNDTNKSGRDTKAIRQEMDSFMRWMLAGKKGFPRSDRTYTVGATALVNTLCYSLKPMREPAVAAAPTPDNPAPPQAPIPDADTVPPDTTVSLKPTKKQRSVLNNAAEGHIARKDVPNVLLAKAASMAQGQEGHVFRSVAARMLEAEAQARQANIDTEALASAFTHDDQRELDFQSYLRRKLVAKKGNIDTVRLPDEEQARHARLRELIARRTLVGRNLDDVWHTVMGDIPMTTLLNANVLRKKGNKQELRDLLDTYSGATGEDNPEMIARHCAAELLLRVLVWQHDHPQVPAQPQTA